MADTVTQISRTEIPDYLRKFQEEILERAQALGKDDGFVLPEYNVAGRSGLQQQASDLTASGLGHMLLCCRLEQIHWAQALAPCMEQQTR